MAAMQSTAQLQFLTLMSSSGSCLPEPQSTPVHQEKVAKPCPQTQNDSHPPKEPSASPSQQVPRLRAVVESQAFKNILVDEMDMMVARAATVIQANWKGYRLRQKLVSQMTAAKAIQEAWRRFSRRRLRRSNKLTVKTTKREDDGDIPYHAPQQVRFHAPEDQPLVMVSKKIQCPSSDNLVPSHAPAAPGPCASRVPRGGLQPQQSVTKYQPSVVTKTARSSSLIRFLEVDSRKSRHVTSKTTKVGSPDSAASGRHGPATLECLKAQTHTEADVPKVPPHTYPVNKTPTKVHPVAATAPKSPAAMHRAPRGAPQVCIATPVTVMKMQSPACSTPSVTRPLAHVRPNPSVSSTTPQVRSVAPMARVQPSASAVTSTGKASPCLGSSINKAPVQTGPQLTATKTLPQTRAVTKSEPQTQTASTSSKTTSQASPSVKLSTQMRLAAMITKTPAQLRSVATVFRTLCLVPTVGASSPRGSPQTPVTPGIPNSPSQVHLNRPKAKVTTSRKQTTTVSREVCQSCLAEGKSRCGPHGRLDPMASKPPARPQLEVEKVKPGPPRASKKEAPPRTDALVATRTLSWTKVTENRSKPLTQIQQKAKVVKVHSRVYVPEEVTVTLSQAQLAVPLAKTSTQTQPPRPPPASPLCKAVSPQSCMSPWLAMGPPEKPHPPGGSAAALSSSTLAAHLMSLTAQLQPSGEQARPVSRTHLATPYPTVASSPACSLGMTLVPPEGYINACPPTSAPQHHVASRPTKSSSQLHPPAERSKTTNSKTTRATGQVCPPTKLGKAPSLAQFITCLAKVPSQAHLPMGLTKAQSQAQLATETAKCFLAAHAATDLSSKPQSQPLLSTSKASIQFLQHFGTLSTGHCAKPDDKSVAQPQLHSHAQNKTTQNPRSVATDTQGMMVPLMTLTGHPVCNTESWGDSGRSRTPPPAPTSTQSVSCHEDLAASITSLCADLVAMLGSPEELRALLTKTLSQGEVRTVLSQALSREVLGPSVAKALPQGMLGMVLMKALSWGELGISLSRTLSRGELRPELSKTTQGKLAEVLCKALTEEERATLSQALWQGELGAVFTQSLAQMAQRTGDLLPKATSKTVGSRTTTAPAAMEMTCSGSMSVAWGPTVGPVQARCSKVRPLWESLPWAQPSEILLGKREGATLEGSPCSPWSPTGSFSREVDTSTYWCPLVTIPTQFQELSSVLCHSLYLRLLDLDDMACGEGPHVPKWPSQQPPSAPWQPLVANGAGPSSSQLPVTSSTAPSSRQPPVASRVSYPGMSYQEGNVVASKHSGDTGGRESPMSQQPFTTCQASVCQCTNQGTVSPCGRCSSKVRNCGSLPKETVRQVLLSRHRRDNKEKVTMSRAVADGQRGSQPSLVHLNPRLQSVSITSNPKQKRHPQAPMTMTRPQSQATGHHKSLLHELLATLPQHPQIVLAKSFQGLPATHCQGGSDSHSSLQSGYSASPSTSYSLPSSEVLEGCREGDLQDSWPVSKEAKKAKHRPQRQLQKTRPAGAQSTASDFQRPPLDLEPLPCRSTRLALNVHWDSESESECSNWDLDEGLSQDTLAPQCRKSQVHARDQKPNGVIWLDQAGGEAPGSRQALEARKGPPRLSQQLETMRPYRSSSHPAGSTAMSPSLAHPSMDSEVAPTLAQPPMDNGGYYGSPTKFSRPFLYYGGSPIYTQQHLTPGAPSNFIHTPATSVSNQAASVVAALSQAHPSPSAHGSPRLTQAAVSSWLPPGCSSRPAQGSGQSDSVQTSVAAGVSANFFQPCVPCSMPSHFSQPCMTTVVTPNYVQPSITHSVSPSLAQPFVVSVVSPTLTHVSLPSRAPPSLSSPYLAPRIRSNLPSVSVASLGALNLLPPTVVCGVGHGVSKPAVGPQQHTQGDSSTAQNQTSRPILCAMTTVGQPSLGSPGDDNLLGTRNQASAQDSIVHSEPTQASKGPPSPMAQPTPSLRQPSVASVENSGLTLGASVPCQAWFGGIAPGVPQGPLATGLYLSVCQGASPPPMAAWASPADVHWTQEQVVVATGVSQSLCPVTVPSVQIPSEFLPNRLGASIPQSCAHLPVTLDPQLLSVTTVAPSSCQYAGLLIPDAAVCAMGGEQVQGSVDGKVPLALAPKPVVESESLNLTQVSMTKDVGKSVPPVSTADGVAQSVPLGSMVDGVAQSVPSESKASGLAQSVPSESMVDGVAQSVPSESMVDGVAQSVPSESMVDGVAQSVPSESMVDGVAQSVPSESMVDGMAQSVPPGSTVDGMAQSVPSESMVDGMAQSVPPGSMVDGMAQSVPSESMVDGMARSVPSEPKVGGLAQNLPLESVISSEAQSPHRDHIVSDVALSLPPGSVASGETSNQPQVIDGGKEKLRPAVDSLPSSHSPIHDPSFVASGAGPTMPLNSVASSVSPGSMLVGISPRPYQAQSGKGSEAHHVTSLAMSTEAQRVTQDPQHLPTVLSSEAQGNQDPGLTEPVDMVNWTLPKTRQTSDTVSSRESVTPEAVPGTGLGATGGERREPEPLAAENILKDQMASKALLGEEAPSKASSVTPVPEQGIGRYPTARSIAPAQSLSSESNSAAPSHLPAPGVPGPQEVLVDNSSSQPLSSNAPVAPQSSPGDAETAKPQDHSKGDQEPLIVKTPSPPNQGNLVSELLEGSINRLAPSRFLTPVSQDSHKQSSGPPTVGVTPTIHVGSGRGQKAPPGVRRLSLGYELSSTSSQRPLLNKAPQDTRHTGKQRTVLALTPHQGQKLPLATEPRVSYDGASLASTTPHGQNVKCVTSSETGNGGGSRIPTAPLDHKHHATVPKTSSGGGPQRAPTLLYSHRLQHIRAPKRSLNGSSQIPKTTPYIQKGHVTKLKVIFDKDSQVPSTPHGHRPHLVTHSKTGHNKISPPPTVPQGPVDAGLASSQPWNSKVPNVSVRGTARAGAPQGVWHPSRGHRPRDPSGAEAALDPKPSSELLVSVRAMERVVIQAAITIQACARGYLVRRTLKVWHQWATIIQATWRGYRVRRNLARLLRATTTIQAAWRSYCVRRVQTRRVLFPTALLEPGGRAQGNLDTRNNFEHRCFLSCQPHICSVCQSLGPRVESTPSVVMLVGSQPRTCHVCGHTLSTRVVQGFGQGNSVQAGARWASTPQQSPQLSRQHRAAVVIQAVWKGYRTRSRLRQQQSAAKVVQATWRGHYTRSCLTTDALLGTGAPWHCTSKSSPLYWPGV